MTANSVRLPYGDSELAFRVDAGARLVGVYTPHATAAAADPTSWPARACPMRACA